MPRRDINIIAYNRRLTAAPEAGGAWKMWVHKACILVELHCNFSSVPKRRALAGRVPSTVAGVATDHGKARGTFLNARPSYPTRDASTVAEVVQYCKRLLQQPGGSARIARLLSENPSLAQEIFANDALSTHIGAAVAEENNTSAALAVLLSIKPLSHAALCGAVASFASKKSLRGVEEIRGFGTKNGMLQGCEGSALWFALIEAYGTFGKVNQAQAAFETARLKGSWTSTDVHLTNIYLHALHSDVSLVFARTRQLIEEGVVVDCATFNILLKACMRAKDGSGADVVMRWMSGAGVSADAITWSSFVKAKSYAGDFEGVLAARQAMETAGFVPTAGVWGSMLVACGSAAQHETALMLWREAKSALGGVCNVPKNVWNAMLVACNACGQAERTLALLEEMKEAGVEPGTTSYNLAIKACEGQPGQRLRPQQLYTAMSLFEDMQSRGLTPDLVTFGTLMELCAAARQGRAAMELLTKMDQAGIKPNVVIMTSLFKALARSGMTDACLRMFSTTVWGPARVRPNRVTFTALVRELRVAGDLSAALKAYDAMRKARFEPNNREFQELIAAAAERALAEGDAQLQAQVASLCNVTSTSELDLHGMSTLEARAAVLCVLSMLLSDRQHGSPPPTHLTIITGWGQHSKGGAAVLPDTIRRLITDELRLVEGGMPCETRGEDDVMLDSNPGRLVISSEDLLRWLDARLRV